MRKCGGLIAVTSVNNLTDCVFLNPMGKQYVGQSRDKNKMASSSLAYVVLAISIVHWLLTLTTSTATTYKEGPTVCVVMCHANNERLVIG